MLLVMAGGWSYVRYLIKEDALFPRVTGIVAGVCLKLPAVMTARLKALVCAVMEGAYCWSMARCMVSFVLK